jgi:hypothetical protein
VCHVTTDGNNTPGALVFVRRHRSDRNRVLVVLVLRTLYEF